MNEKPESEHRGEPMKGKTTSKARLGGSLLIVTGLCIGILAVNGCCTTDCCLSEQCKQATACVDPYVRTMKIVDDRLTGCPNLWSSVTVMANDTVEIVNCGTQKAHLKYTPVGLFNEGGEFDLLPGERLVLTVKSTVTVGQIADLVVTGQGTCGHAGSRVIVGAGP